MVMDELGCVTQREFAERLELGGNGPVRVGRWLRGDTEPDFDGMVRMLWKTGRLRLRPPTAAERHQEAEAIRQVVRGVLRRLEEWDPGS